jgi:lipoyl synthase
MLFIENNSTDPFFNHALEEYFLTTSQEEAFILWRNRPSILIGRNQNTLSEINLAYVKENKIDVVRRLSGGGTVFCDLGNINFTFITNKTGQEIGFEKFARPVIDALLTLGITAEFSGRNDILIEGKKISGNAQYHYKQRLLHHGTLLFNGDLSTLKGALVTKPLKFKDKSVKSVASRVTNIYPYLNPPMDVLDFKRYLQDTLMKQHQIQTIHHLSDEEIRSIRIISKDRFESDSWNYGSSPAFTFENTVKYSCGLVEFHLNIKKGIIITASICGDFFGIQPISELEKALLGVPYMESSLIEACESVTISDYISGLSLDDFISGLLNTYTYEELPLNPDRLDNTSQPPKPVLRKPSWIRVPIHHNSTTQQVKHLIDDLKLHTVCLEANCPNRMECYNRKTATFMILGRNCTRNCTFCNVTQNTPTPLDLDEPHRVAQAVSKLGLKHAVITSVTRDDLPDQGAHHFATVVKEIRSLCPSITIELLIPDLQGKKEHLTTILDTHPDILNHNIETVPSLYKKIRPMADYERSLDVIRFTKAHYPWIKTKSGMMLGLGETQTEVIQTLNDLHQAGCDILTLGQYLQPSKAHVELVEYITPDMFEAYKQKALVIGFVSVASAPLVRSSYHADELI